MPLIRVHRIDHGFEDKKIWQSSCVKNKKPRELSARVVPYKLHDALKDLEAGSPHVYWVEGEQCADAMLALGLPAVTSLGGSKGFHRERDAGHIPGDRLVIVPDKDKPGLSYAKQVAEAHPECQWLLPFPDSPQWTEGLPDNHGRDIADWINEGAGAAEILAAIQKDPSQTKNNTKVQESPTPPDVGKVQTVAELRQQRKPTEWIINEFGASGNLVLLAADKGVGKTSFMYGAANAIQTGGLFLGQLPTQKRNVLIWQADESIKNAVEKMEIVDMHGGVQFLFGEESYRQSLDIERLDKRVHENKIGAVFLDSMTTLLTGGEHSIKDPEFCAPLYALNRWAGLKNVLVVIAAHLRKSDDSKTTRKVTMDTIIGSGIQSAAASDIWLLWKPDVQTWTDHYVLECFGKRNCQEGTIWNLQGNADDYSFDLKSTKEGDILPQQRLELKLEAQQVITTSEKQWHPKDLASHLKANPEHVRRICRELLTEKEIEREYLPSTGGRPSCVYCALRT